MAKKVLTILFGLALVPFCFGFTWQLFLTVFSARYKPAVPYYFFGGAVAYLTLHMFFRKPIFTYVVGHELTHAFFAMLFGGSVKSFQASERGGRVTITKSNFIITLAPYFFPLYTCISFMLYWIALASGMSATVVTSLIILSGATFMFHLVLTLMFLRTDQNDIMEHGAIFSYPLIYLFNVIFAVALLRFMLTDDMDLLQFFVHGIMKSTKMITHLVYTVPLLLIGT